MKDKNIKDGEFAYTVHGEKVFVLMQTGAGYVVNPVVAYDRGDGDVEEDIDENHVTVIKNLYLSVDDVFAPEVEEYKSQVNELKDEIKRLEEEVENRKGERRMYDVLCSQHDALKNLFDFIEGKVSHYVEVPSYGVAKIYEREEAKETIFKREGKQRLLSLFGKSNGDLQWRINQYSDGSGSYYKVYPCKSLEDSHEKAREVCHDVFAQYLSGKRKSIDGPKWFAFADSVGADIPNKVKEKIAEAKRSGIESRIERLTKDIEDAQRELSENGGSVGND